MEKGFFLIWVCLSFVGQKTWAQTHKVPGNGPVIVLESGLGDDHSTWSPVAKKLGRLGRVFRYDRAGYGSRPIENPRRDGLTLVAELRAQLAEAHLEPPYLLVGHSMGGMVVELFARHYPNEVMGVIFVDARHAQFTQWCRESGEAKGCDLPKWALALMPQAAQLEFAAMEQTQEQIRQSPPFPAVPVAVLTGTRKPFTNRAFRSVWLESQNQLAQLSPISNHQVCEKCGHYIHRDKPKLLIEAVEWVLAQ